MRFRSSWIAAGVAATAAADQKKENAAAADFQRKHAQFDNPLLRGPYDQQRSVVDFFDHEGRRYHIGVFGQRIYD